MKRYAEKRDEMKKLFNVLVIWAILFVFPTNILEAQEGKNYTFLTQNHDKTFHLLIDQDSTKYLPGDIVRVLVRYEYKKSYSGKRSYDCKKCGLMKSLSHINFTEEFNCNERTFKKLQLTEYYLDDAPYTEHMDAKWQNITPKSIEEILFNYVCKYKRGR
jgi:hypothetical protein